LWSVARARVQALMIIQFSQALFDDDVIPNCQ
jgi:hypothetical protein